MLANLEPTDLHGGIARFLGELAWALRPDTPDEVASLEVCREHGEQRASLEGYRLQDVVHEYSVRRRIVLEVLQGATSFDAREQDVVLDSIDRGVSQAVERYAHAQEALRRQLVAVLTHDLRNPLSAAAMSAQLILRQPGDVARTATLAAKVADHRQRVDRLIRDLLDVTRLNAGQPLPVETEPCDLRAIALSVVEDLTALHGDRFHVRSERPTTGRWSAEGLRRVLENLLGNAVKYGKPDTPIRIELEGRDRELTLRVRNQGEPMAPEDLKRLATPFFRAAAAASSRAPGWGLGLTMVRGMVRAHGGRLSVDSTRCDGTTFSIILPGLSS